jgi:hypothetical protein
LGGSNEDSNKIKLTLREHFICHMLLTKMLEGKAKSKMIWAAKMISATNKLNSHLYHSLKADKTKRHEYDAKFRAKLSLAKKGFIMSDLQKKKLSDSVKGFKHTIETKKKISESSKGRMTPELAKKISIAKMGIATRGSGWITPASTKEKQKLSNLGKKRSIETKTKLRESKIGKIWMYNPVSLERKFISIEESKLLIGWVRGRKIPN